MARRTFLILIVSAMVLFGGWVVVGQTPSSQTLQENERRALERELAELLTELGPEHPKVKLIQRRIDLLKQEPSLPASGEAGRYTMIAGPQAHVLLDTRTGQSWYLRGGKPGTDEPVWVPIKRLP